MYELLQHLSKIVTTLAIKKSTKNTNNTYTILYCEGNQNQIVSSMGFFLEAYTSQSLNLAGLVPLLRQQLAEQ